MNIVLKKMPGQSGLFSLLVVTVLMVGCGGAETCEEPQFYESATGGKRIETPDDLSELQALNEMVIPEASPRPPREADSGCLDRPPTLRVD